MFDSRALLISALQSHNNTIKMAKYDKKQLNTIKTAKRGA